MENIQLNQPQSPRELFLSFSGLSLKAFGGIMAFAEEMIVEKKKWLSKKEFLEEWSVAQTMPGAAVMNLSIMIGSRHFGIAGAAAGVTGIMLFPMILILCSVSAFTYFGQDPHLIGALRGMGAVSAGLLIATGAKLISPLKANPLGLIPCAFFSIACFGMIAVLRFPLSSVLLGLGPIACAMSYFKLDQKIGHAK
ncbi:hypothetical protein A9236_08135 [Polynucleobacter sp. QLW-P1DATA-2]|uniref:chromate transporter n=1 Tax=unclassified Polynucleobacter TaxID=2640945 RepID=UPI0008F86BA0|nr:MULTISPECIES: chromate transporter [unclassified Polynucleobacter]OIN01127.1 hypothetical protein A9236_08135 [Polynucleobacter sp. QLW-P1DATA-2]OIN02695.1 hypothetical protein A9235_03190 [Polynucleobacter sp. MWH-Tro8-2-5-gr]